MEISSLLSCYVTQIEDLSQQAQMAAAEKFKTTEPPAVVGEAPSSAVETVHESDEDEVKFNCINALDVRQLKLH